MSTSVTRILRSSVLPFIVLILVSFGFVTVHATAHGPISPFDEYVYLDYLAKVPTEGLVRSGEETGDVARNAISCRGVLNYGAYGEGCNTGTHQDDKKYPYNGGTGADIYTPLYFAATWVAAQPLTWFGVDLLDSGRLVGGLWLALGLSLTYALLRLLRVDKAIALGLSLSLIATPVVLWATTYLSTDAPTLAVAAAVGCVAVLVARRRIHVAWLPAISAVAVLFKVQNLAAVGAAVVGVVAWTFMEAHRSERGGSRHPVVVRSLVDRRTIAAVVALIAGVGAQAAWLVFRVLATPANAKSAVVDSVRQPLSLTSLVTEAFRFLRSIGSTDAVANVLGVLTGNLLTILVIAALIGILIDWRSRPVAHTSVALAVLLAALAMGPALSLAVRASVGFYFPLPARYGLVLVPGFLAALGLYFYRFSRFGRSVVLGLGSLAALAALLM
ncbi:hypothetical protein [Cryobacterium sp. 5B3]|uniref:hypothetical protein n=1 Tax=Cryobacterium sp. 5B3 TaxID=3048586 RepID=UPI002AB41902|nr:hypothetical protein [Cryobacterium sp. 5B3]MDY7542786.1 hypothetical protein [Cryobacterium sp. 5B3]MEB0273984.1 hypothetical protein [Cryobacterium sp. 5B3]